MKNPLGEPKDFFKPVDDSCSLSDINTMTPTYAACFEFLGKADSQLRLEVNFRQRALEIEQGHHRWFKTRKGNSDQTHNSLPLQVGVVDFRRYFHSHPLQYCSPCTHTNIDLTGRRTSKCSSQSTKVRLEPTLHNSRQPSDSTIVFEFTA